MRSSFIVALGHMPRRRRQPQAQAPRQAEGGEEEDAGVWEREHPAGGVHRGAADGGGVVGLLARRTILRKRWAVLPNTRDAYQSLAPLQHRLLGEDTSVLIFRLHQPVPCCTASARLQSLKTCLMEEVRRAQIGQ